MANTINLRDVITEQAVAQGVDPSIALAVAQTESRTSQWTPTGNLVTSPQGALGIFQLMPATAAALGVDPTDVNQNIQGGITYLKQLYAKYGDWTTALAAYNFGPGNVDSGKSWPAETLNYVKSILGIGANYAAGLAQVAQNAVSGSPPGLSVGDIETSVSGLSPGVIAVAGLVGVGLLAWYLSD
ncbi:MAG: lytic transglycosylase domain-containing protein [Terriglobales bacterium]